MTFQREISNALSYITANGYQIHPEAFKILKNHNSNIMDIIQKVVKFKKTQNDHNNIILIQDIKNFCTINISVECDNLATDSLNISQNLLKKSNEIDEFEILSRQKHTSNKSIYNRSFKIIYDSTDYIDPEEGVNGYISLFKDRFNKTLKILSSRPESKHINKITSIKRRIKQNHNNLSSNGNTSIIAGLVMSKRSKKNGIELAIDDLTGIINTIALNEETIKLVSKLTLDQMVMLEIENKGINYIIKNVISPDIPDHIPNKGKFEEYVILISDLHIGSKYFKENEFSRFLNWLNSPENEIASKIKFLCIGGDLIDGVGIFPNQEKELYDSTIYLQMKHLTSLLEQIPKRIQVFVIPGNHDLGRRALPQPAIPKKDAEILYSWKNFTMLGNPSYIELNGVKILMYHGQGLDDIIATIPGLSYSNPAEAMKTLLKARHLSPVYGQRTPLSAEKEDMMVITEIPDILHSGHVHIMDVQNYRGTLIVNSGTWQAQTPFQQTMGIMPTPGIAIAVNLSTLRPFQIDFSQ
ncbi:MAG TPA: DNA-directed DNA polymerase II small subunit [Nitrososphaeraceae archaeon]|nr:DNA-directed DNA polymerase II small subunit [Nitrososphaeraceae archaeon]